MSTDASDEWVALGTRLRSAREYLALSQHDVTVSTGIPRSAISDIERGQRKVDSLELRKLAKLYRRPVSALLAEETDDSDARTDAGTHTALARAVRDLTGDDQEELVRFAEFLRYQSRLGGRNASTGGAS